MTLAPLAVPAPLPLPLRPLAAASGSTASARIRVAVCDDSLVVRGAILRILRRDPAIEVVGQARHGEEALRLVQTHQTNNPIEVIVLEVEMPVMDGLTALPRLLELDRRLKVVMASTLTRRGASISLQALHGGASDYVPKPDASNVANSEQFAADLLAKIRGLGQMRRRALPAAARPTIPQVAAPAPPIAVRPARIGNRPRLLAVGSSTGGPQALFAFFKALGPRLRVPVVLTQHMPASFIPALAEHINNVGGLSCSVARDGERLRRDHILVAPGDRHMLIRADGTALYAKLSDEPPENFCRPAVDPMLRSAAAACGGAVLVLMLTGMGRDGLVGTRDIVERGGEAIAQDEASSVVWGMPGAIAQAGLCRDILPLTRLPAAIRELVGT